MSMLLRCPKCKAKAVPPTKLNVDNKGSFCKSIKSSNVFGSIVSLYNISVLLF